MPANKIMTHYTAAYLLDPQHPVTVKVIGCGGTGSKILQGLAAMNASLLALGHPGFLVQAFDDDKVTEANLGRQLFSPCDVDQYKSKILVERINRFYGFNWQAVPLKYGEQEVSDNMFANILITCVDNVATRELVQSIKNTGFKKGRDHQYNCPVYWMDLGNGLDHGQVVIGTMSIVNQPKRSRNTVKTLPTIMELFPDLKKHESKDTTPSCSLAEALGKQDLFINTNLANMGLALLWKMFREAKTEYHGLFLNLKNLTSNPIPIK